MSGDVHRVDVKDLIGAVLIAPVHGVDADEAHLAPPRIGRAVLAPMAVTTARVLVEDTRAS